MMINDLNNLLNCLTNRKEWYENAAKMKAGEVKYENGFDFPDGNINTYDGAIKELNNSIDMIEHMIQIIVLQNQCI